jgi:hypothetical protein
MDIIIFRELTPRNNKWSFSCQFLFILDLYCWHLHWVLSYLQALECKSYYSNKGTISLWRGKEECSGTFLSWADALWFVLSSTSTIAWPYKFIYNLACSKSSHYKKNICIFFHSLSVSKSYKFIYNLACSVDLYFPLSCLCEGKPRHGAKISSCHLGST